MIHAYVAPLLLGSLVILGGWASLWYLGGWIGKHVLGTPGGLDFVDRIAGAFIVVAGSIFLVVFGYVAVAIGAHLMGVPL